MLHRSFLARPHRALHLVTSLALCAALLIVSLDTPSPAEPIEPESLSTGILPTIRKSDLGLELVPAFTDEVTTATGRVKLALGVSGAIWLDGDADGRRSSPREYAERLFADGRGDLAKVCKSLEDFDGATAAQVAHLVRLAGVSPDAEQMSTLLRSAAPAVKQGFAAYRDTWRESEWARAVP